jgi:hypothetical protein
MLSLASHVRATVLQYTYLTSTEASCVPRGCLIMVSGVIRDIKWMTGVYYPKVGI